MIRRTRICMLAMAIVLLLLPSAAAQDATEPASQELSANDVMIDSFIDAYGVDEAAATELINVQIAASELRSSLLGLVGRDRLAGLWIDHTVPEVVLGISDASVVSDIQPLLDQFAFPQYLRLETMQYSLAELDTANTTFLRVWAAMNAQLDHPVVSSMPVEHLNRFVVLVHPSSTMEVQAILGAEMDLNIVEFLPFDDGAYAQQTACSGSTEDSIRDGCPALRGGLRLVRSNGNKCSSGFNAYQGTTRYLITAGHCGANGVSWVHNGKTVGSITRSVVSPTLSLVGLNARPVDAARIEVTSSAFLASPANRWVFVNRTAQAYQIRAVRDDVPPGSLLCKTGITTYHTCDTVITNNSNALDLEGLRYYDQQWAILTCLRPGDSGGPIYGPLSVQLNTTFQTGYGLGTIGPSNDSDLDCGLGVSAISRSTLNIIGITLPGGASEIMWGPRIGNVARDLGVIIETRG